MTAERTVASPSHHCVRSPLPATDRRSGMITALLDIPRVLTIKTYAVLGARRTGDPHPRQDRVNGRATRPQ